MMIPKEYHLPDSYEVVVCEECGFVFTDTSASMEDYDWYYTNCNFYGDNSKDENNIQFEMARGFLEKYIDIEEPLLEMGAGNGLFGMALK